VPPRERMVSGGKRPLDSSGGNNLFDPVAHGLTFKSENGPSAVDCTGTLRCGFAFCWHLRISMVQQHNQDNQGDRYSNEPKKNWHDVFLSSLVVNDAVLFCPMCHPADLRLQWQRVMPITLR